MDDRHSSGTERRCDLMKGKTMRMSASPYLRLGGRHLGVTILHSREAKQQKAKMTGSELLGFERSEMPSRPAKDSRARKGLKRVKVRHAKNGAILAVGLGLGLAGCGSSAPHQQAAAQSSNTTPTTTAAPAPPTPAEQAVLHMSRLIYPTQGIVAATCAKTGFSPSGETDACVLRSNDGSVTTSSDWSILQGPNGIIGAEPTSAANAPASTGCGDGSSPGAGGTDANGNPLCADGLAYMGG